MKEQKDIFNRIKDNQHKLEERPAPQLWDRLEERLDQAEEKPLAIRSQLYRRLSVVAALIALVGMIGLVNLLMQQNAGQDNAMAEMTAAPKQWEDLNRNADSKTEAWYRYAASQHRLNQRPSIQEGAPSKKLVAQKMGPQSTFFADHRDSNTNATVDQFAFNSKANNATSIRNESQMPKEEAASAKTAVANGSDPISSSAATSTVMAMNEIGEEIANTANDEKRNDEAELYVYDASDQAVGYANPAARKKQKPSANGTRYQAAGVAKEKYAKVLGGIQQFSWLLGKWENETGAKRSTESWEMINEFTIAGKGELTVNGQTTFTEAMTIQKVDQELYYVMVLDESGKTVRYKLKSFQQNEAVFENTQIDFPKQVILRQLDSGNYVTVLQNNNPTKVGESQQIYLNNRNAIRKEQFERKMSRAKGK
ncbi:MAG: DUF6265 family protein [Bacteroidota bacterium]